MDMRQIMDRAAHTCETPGAQFNITIKPDQLGCVVDLPPEIELDIDRETAEQVEDQLHNALETVVGEIVDEHDPDAEQHWTASSERESVAETMRRLFNVVEYPILEANRIGSAVTLREIPPQYRDHKVLGRGATTIALDLDATHVLLFTRDRMKLEWLQEEGLVEIIGSYESSNHIVGMHELPIYILKCVKLEPLSQSNKRIVTKLCKEFVSVRFKNLWGKHRDATFQAIYNHFGSDEKHILYRLMNFLANYDSSQYGFDLGVRNFMQTNAGEIVVLDPIACSELCNLIRANSKEKYNSRGARW